MNYRTVVFIPVFLTVIIGFYIGYVDYSRSASRGLAILEASSAFLFLAFYGLTFHSSKYMYYRGVGAKYSLYFVYFVLIYALVSVFIGLFLGNSFKYIVGDLFRYLIYPITFLSLYGLYSKRKKEFLHDYLYVSFLLAILMVIGKVVLVASGKLYGAGLNQFYPGNYIMVVLFGCLFFKTDLLRTNKLITFLFLTIVVILVVFSLKRTNWIALIFCFVLVSGILPLWKKAIFISVVVLAILFFYKYMNDNYFIQQVIGRFMYSFNSSGTDELDSSSMQRIAEIKSALTVINEYPLITYLFGLGSGAEYQKVGMYSDILRNSGSKEHLVHHIHSFYFLMVFRYGVIGMLLYIMIPVLLLFKLVFLMCGRILNIDGKIYCLALFSSISFAFVEAMKGNAFYGNINYAFVLIAAVFFVDFVRDKNEENIYSK